MKSRKFWTDSSAFLSPWVDPELGSTLLLGGSGGIKPLGLRGNPLIVIPIAFASFPDLIHSCFLRFLPPSPSKLTVPQISLWGLLWGV